MSEINVQQHMGRYFVVFDKKHHPVKDVLVDLKTISEISTFSSYDKALELVSLYIYGPKAVGKPSEYVHMRVWDFKVR